MKDLYIVRHAKAEGQPPWAKLTDLGEDQAKMLVRFFEGREVDAVYSSPFLRAVKTIEPLAADRGLPIIQDERLGERVLSGTNLDDWMMHLERSFEDFEYVLDGGESNRAAYERASSFIEELIKSDHECVIAVSHGNLATLLLKFFAASFGYKELLELSNPDVYHINFAADTPSVNRIWEEA
ncbi:histidine phosphatase family protein [Bacillus salacetis]|uniref:Histidine phosphatase family protein n=1 Tax=Bacillus salacetis TaxID=2315464 RepID=A0A3A1QXS8_9BACI|nr:histidine phosphatase family protein [Bacillus salacetis]RIW33601.1 histidine phosphatase family protein [Bacillus salacetis]